MHQERDMLRQRLLNMEAKTAQEAAKCHRFASIMKEHLASGQAGLRAAQHTLVKVIPPAGTPGRSGGQISTLCLNITQTCHLAGPIYEDGNRDDNLA